MNRLSPALAVCLLFPLSLPVAAGSGPGPRVELVRHELLGWNAGAPWIRVDLDGEAPDEFATLVNDNGRNQLAIARYAPGDDGGRVKLLALRATDPDIGHALLLRVEGRFRGQPDQLALVAGSRVQLFSGAGAAHAVSYAITPSWSQGINAVADLDDDGDLDILRTASADSMLEARDLAGNSRLWAVALQPVQAALAQLDEDPALEVVVHLGTAGQVLDGATGASAWTYAGGFGELVVGNVDEDALDEFLGLTGQSAVVFDSMPYAPVGDFPIHAIATRGELYDSDGDGRDELWMHAWSTELSQDAAVAYGVPDGLVRATVPTPAFFVNTMTPGRYASDGVQLLLGAVGAGGTPALGVVDVASGTTLAEVPQWSLPPHAMALADLRGDGRLELVFAGATDTNDWHAPQLHTWDFASGTPARSIDNLVLFPSSDGEVATIAVAQMDADPAQELLLGGRRSGTWAAAVDGASLAVQWVHEGSGTEPSWIVRTLAAAGDHVALGIEAAGGNRLRLLDATGEEAWASVPMSTGGMAGVHAGDLDHDGTADVTLFGGNGVWSYTDWGAFSWSLPVAARFWHAPPGKAQLLAFPFSGEASLVSVPDGGVIDSWPVSAFDAPLSMVADIGDGYLVLGQMDGRLERMDASNGTRVDLGIRVDAGSELNWAVAPSRHRTEQVLVIGTRYGFAELRVLSAEHVFGGSEGGFE